MPEPLLGLEKVDFANHLSSLLPGYRVAQLYTALYRQRCASFSSITTLPGSLRSALEEDYVVGWPQIAQRFESVDGTRRYLLRLSDGKRSRPFSSGESATRSVFPPRWAVRWIASSASPREWAWSEILARAKSSGKCW